MKFAVPILFIFVISFSVACDLAPPPKTVGGGSPNQPMPPSKSVEEMTWTIFNPQTNVDEGKNKLKDLQGKAVILDFWATYCPPCLEEIPHLRQLQEKYGKDNLVVIGLHVGGDEDRVSVPAFAQRLQIDYTLATPEDELTTFIFGNRSDIPQTAVFDRQGKLVEKFIGFGEPIKKNLDAAVEKAVNQK